MNWKLNGLTAALMGAGLVLGGGNVSAQEIDNTNCGALQFEGLGEETCAFPNPLPGEGVLFTAAEQAVSIVAAIADDVGCPAIALTAGTVPVKIEAINVFPQTATTTIGTAKFDTVEEANTEHYAGPFVHNGVRQHRTTLTQAGAVLGSSLSFTGLTAVDGLFISDGPYSIMKGASLLTHNGDVLSEDLIKDFYQGVPVSGEESQQQTGNLANARVIRDNGLEVTDKVHTVGTLPTGTAAIGHPKGKWRQTSFYRGPDGGDGVLTYTKVRIAPFGKAECAMQLTGAVTGSLSFPTFNGKITVVPLSSTP